MLSMKDLVFKERPVRKLVNWYVSLYIIEEVVFTNAIKLRLLTLMRIHPAVNISWVVRYKILVKGQKIKEVKSIEIDEVEEWEIDKILNKKNKRNNKVFGILEGFTVENNT